MNVHTIKDYANNNKQQESNVHSLNVDNNNNNNQGNNVMRYFNREVFHFKTCSFIIICFLFKFYVVSVGIYYLYSMFKEKSWKCLLYQSGALQIGKFVNEFKIWNLVTAMFLHNDLMHFLSNTLSLIFISFYVEFLINSTVYFLLFFFATGIYGNITSLLFNGNNISIGISGVILGLCGYLIIYFIIEYNKMENNQKICFGIFIGVIILNFFVSIFISEQIEIYAHIGGLASGILLAIILFLSSSPLYKFSHIASEKVLKIIKYICIVLLVLYPIISLCVIFTGKYPNVESLICKVESKTNI